MFDMNGLHISHIKKIMADNWPFWPALPIFLQILHKFELIRAISEMDVWYKF